jgi:hypothetical protein
MKIKQLFNKLFFGFSDRGKAFYIIWVLINLLILFYSNPTTYWPQIWPFETQLNRRFVQVDFNSNGVPRLFNGTGYKYDYLNPRCYYDYTEFILYTVVPFLVILAIKRYKNQKLKCCYILWVILQLSLFAISYKDATDKVFGSNGSNGDKAVIEMPLGINFYPFTLRRLTTIKNIGEILNDSRSMEALGFYELDKSQIRWLSNISNLDLFVYNMHMGEFNGEFHFGWKPVYSWIFDPRDIYDLKTLIVYLLFPPAIMYVIMLLRKKSTLNRSLKKEPDNVI